MIFSIFTSLEGNAHLSESILDCDKKQLALLRSLFARFLFVLPWGDIVTHDVTLYYMLVLDACYYVMRRGMV